MKSAVEWLSQELNNLIELYPSEWEKINKVFEQAKEMEKKQICNAWENGYDELDRAGRISLNYYNETYKNNQP